MFRTSVTVELIYFSCLFVHLHDRSYLFLVSTSIQCLSLHTLLRSQFVFFLFHVLVLLVSICRFFSRWLIPSRKGRLQSKAYKTSKVFYPPWNQTHRPSVPFDKLFATVVVYWFLPTTRSGNITDPPANSSHTRPVFFTSTNIEQWMERQQQTNCYAIKETHWENIASNMFMNLFIRNYI
jgi:hypothetical protein